MIDLPPCAADRVLVDRDGEKLQVLLAPLGGVVVGGGGGHLGGGPNLARAAAASAAASSAAAANFAFGRSARRAALDNESSSW